MTRKLLIATTNAGKAREISRMIMNLPVDCINLRDLDNIEEAPEDYATFDENAVSKARHYGIASGLPTIAEDAGLSIPALDEWPGVQSSRIAPTDRQRVSIVLKRLADEDVQDRRAQFVSVAVFFDPGNNTMRIFKGTLDGFLRDEPVGSNGFGYDPIFWVDEYQRTLAQLSTEEKNRISHRGKSFRAFAAFLKTYEW